MRILFFYTAAALSSCIQLLDPFVASSFSQNCFVQEIEQLNMGLYIAKMPGDKGVPGKPPFFPAGK